VYTVTSNANADHGLYSVVADADPAAVSPSARPTQTLYRGSWLRNPLSVAVDSASGYIFVADDSSPRGIVLRTDLDGSNPQPILLRMPDDKAVLHVAVGEGGWLYVLVSRNGVYRARYDGTEFTQVIAPTGIAAELGGGSERSISIVPPSGSRPEELLLVVTNDTVLQACPNGTQLQVLYDAPARSTSNTVADLRDAVFDPRQGVLFFTVWQRSEAGLRMLATPPLPETTVNVAARSSMGTSQYGVALDPVGFSVCG